jgi:hypothetical protein
MPSTVTVDVQTGRSSAVRRETSSLASWLIPASASVTSTARDTGSKRGLGAGPRSVPGSTTATSSMKRIPTRTSRTWSQYSAIDHMAGIGRRPSSSSASPPTALNQRAGSPAMAATAPSSVQQPPSNPHSSQRSIATAPASHHPPKTRFGSRRPVSVGGLSCCLRCKKPAGRLRRQLAGPWRPDAQSDLTRCRTVSAQEPPGWARCGSSRSSRTPGSGWSVFVLASPCPSSSPTGLSLASTCSL